MRNGVGLTVLDTAFGDGLAFLHYLQEWLAQADRGPVLHYVGLLENTRSSPWHPELAKELDLADGLGLQAGFHRFVMRGGQVSLTLCIGPTTAMLNEQSMQAQRLWIRAKETPWDKWAAKALARSCGIDAQVSIDASAAIEPQWLREAGFVESTESGAEPAHGTASGCTHHYHPPWGTKKPLRHRTTGRTCAIVGAGLSGASVAQALAVRGWRVTVLEQAPQVAAGASGLPVGLVVAHVSADDAPRSRISRSGTRLMLHHTKALLSATQDWDLSGVQERRLAEGHTIWHAQAAWVKPAQLVKAWLRTAGIDVKTNAAVASMQRSDNEDGPWALLDRAGRTLCQVDHVVFANAIGAQALLLNTQKADAMVADLLPKLQALHPMYGTLSLGACPDPMWTGTELAAHVHPVNGKGSFVPNIPTPDGLRWYAGSTFEFDAVNLENIAQQQEANQVRLERLLPQVASVLADAFQKAVRGETDGAQSWSAQRCATHDRLPLVGPVFGEPSNTVWMCAGMGSRGLSFTAVCAELLASYMGGEPLPLENSLARSLHTTRRYRKPAQSPVTELG